jgi:hypothetical protein
VKVVAALAADLLGEAPHLLITSRVVTWFRLGEIDSNVAPACLLTSMLC